MGRVKECVKTLVWLLDELLDRIPAYEDGHWYRYGHWGCRLHLHRYWWAEEGDPVRGGDDDGAMDVRHVVLVNPVPRHPCQEGRSPALTPGSVLLARVASRKDIQMSTGTIRRIDSSGDTVLAEWDTAELATVEEARKIFDKEVARGNLMVRCDPGTDLSGQRITKFDPEAGDILAAGRYAGG